MEFTVRGDTYARVARINVPAGESVEVRSLALLGFAGNVSPQSPAPASLLGALRKSVDAFSGGSDSLMMHAPQSEGWVDVVGQWPGDIVALNIVEATFLVQGRSWLAHDAGLRRNSPKTDDHVFNRDMDLFSGSGTLLLASHGTIEVVSLQPGERVSVMQGHLLALEERGNAARVPFGGRSMQGFEIVGPGQVMVQTRTTAIFRDS